MRTSTGRTGGTFEPGTYTNADELAERIAQRVAELLSSAEPASLMDAEQAATLLAVPKTWVLAEARANRIPHVRFGRYVRFEPAALSDWWQARRQGPWRDRGVAAASARAGARPARNGSEAG